MLEKQAFPLDKYLHISWNPREAFAILSLGFTVVEATASGGIVTLAPFPLQQEQNS